MSDPDREFKALLYDQLARIGKAVANPHRLELIDVLTQGERRVDDLARQTGLSIANTSQHLQALRRAGLAKARRAGTAVYYSVADAQIVALWHTIRSVGEARLAEVEHLVGDYLAHSGGLEAIDADTLRRRMAVDAVTVIDVRPESEYASGHLPGARSIPLPELLDRMGELPADHQVVAYCRGPYCVMADDAVRLLAASGYQASRLADGFPEWQVAGHPVEPQGAADA